MKILITAGPTREPIDPVRYLTNRSSGKMGYAIARAAVNAGHQVMLISGPTEIEVPDNVDYLGVSSAADMYDAVATYLPRMDAAYFSAAVADYTPIQVADEKIKKSGDRMTIELEKTKDILGSARSVIGFDGYLVGFAAETQNLIANARKKLETKDCNMIVANDVSRTDIGFDSNDNAASLVFPDRVDEFKKGSKDELAKYLVSMLGG